MPKRTEGAGPTVRVTVGSRGGGDVFRAAREAADAGVDVRQVGPTGATWREPLVAMTRDGRTAVYGGVTPTGVRGLLNPFPDELLEPPAETVGDGDALPWPSEGPLAAGERRVLARCGWVDPTDPAPMGETDPEALKSVARETGVRGRGRADAADGPVVEEWDEAREADGDPVVVVNGNDADPNADADRLLLESDPASVVDGALAVADVVGATDVVAFLGERHDLARSRLDALKENLKSSTVSVGPGTFEVATGPDAFEVGEPTMALEALEGNDRIEARRRPPGPATYGLYGRPTVVHTPRTVAQLREAVRAEAAKDHVGAPDDPETWLVTVCGDSPRATVELPTDASLSRALDAVDRPGPSDGLDFEMACVGGQFGGLTRSLDVPANADAMAAADLGENGVVELFDGSRCAVAVAGRRARFAEERNCGRCVPCREGSKQLQEKLRDVYDGDYDAAGLRELLRSMRDTSLCQFGVAAARPTRTAMDEFEPEFLAHADGRCPSGECEP
ncbi:NADH dehydrogenase FAD-containing subunit [Halostella sp. JP-L12]|uniref:NADH-ubiquinone oxidoreductase-F iron-sulfur binding region domain-containing protein n=1 Tax=Halostella TaxID=1843185 RepID=UPI000EF7A5F1|nr:MULTISPECIES: NADH-ubiquinone oxidoreductase-F iron-sulfur binding region domain-containing protein [Halostella]NHN49134.1 NADH dehydrogenase FAD-containing subunit [Halostella sp. JP-L12]